VSRASTLGIALIGLILVVLATWSLPLVGNNYVVRVATVMCINAILVASLALANGFTGVF
jgi:branched-chain amino acid transport system permease protein